MITIRRILVPVDFSDTSRLALTRARELADRLGAQLHLLHVVPLAYLGPVSTDLPMVSLDDVETQWVHRAEDELRALASSGGDDEPKARAEVRRGHPFVEIVRYAQSEQIDLIVMGTHGRGAMEHLLLGSVAEKVVRKAPCPVLTVRHPDHRFTMPTGESAGESTGR